MLIGATCAAAAALGFLVVQPQGPLSRFKSKPVTVTPLPADLVFRGSGVVVFGDRLVVRRSHGGCWGGFLVMSLARRSPSLSASGGFWVVSLLLEGLGKGRCWSRATSLNVSSTYRHVLLWHG